MRHWRVIMRPCSVALAVIFSFGISLAGASPLGTAPPGPITNSQRSVLFLSSDDFTRPYVRLMFETFGEALQTAPESPAVYFESVDSLRFQEPQYLDNVREWLRHKYESRAIDLIVPIGEPVVQFLADGHGEPWPTAQVLYLEVASMSVETRTALPHTGGLLLEEHFGAAMATIKSVLPATKRVALVYGASNVERSRFSGYANKVRAADLDPLELIGSSADALRAAVAHLPSDTVILSLAPNVDANGHVLSANSTCQLISSAASVPLFTLGLQDLGCGVVGGLQRDWSLVGRLLGEEALARLRAPSTAIVTVPVAKYNTLAFDDRQLQRWRIPESRLPPGAVVRFREPSLWRDHRSLVIAALAVTLLQSALIAGLVFEHRRRRRAEMDSRRNLAAMAHMDRRAAMGELATSLAHELNQPLNAILQNAGVAQMLMTSHPVPTELAEMTDIINDIRKDDLRASEVIRRMRGLLQKREFESHPVDLNEVVQETIAIVRPDAKARGIELDATLADGAGPVLGDRIHLQQVLLNLLINAMDAVAAGPADRRRVRVETKRTNGEVKLAVEDTGRGIPGDRLTQIFEPFYTTKREGSGMGMGLAIARGIVEAHGGRMAAENNAYGGATVWFSVPVS